MSGQGGPSITIEGADRLRLAQLRVDGVLPSLQKKVRAAISLGLRHVRTDIERDLRTGTSLGRKFWTRSKKPQGMPPLIVSLMKTKIAPSGTIETGIALKGMAAKIATGGRTKPHKISARVANALVFTARGGELVVVPKGESVSHPGGEVRQNNALARYAPRIESTLKSLLEAAVLDAALSLRDLRDLAA